MTALALAIERRQWPLVSLYLLTGVADAAQKLPPGSLAALLELLAPLEPDAKGGPRP